jgi:hypothetical protein
MDSLVPSMRIHCLEWEFWMSQVGVWSMLPGDLPGERGILFFGT